MVGWGTVVLGKCGLGWFRVVRVDAVCGHVYGVVWWCGVGYGYLIILMGKNALVVCVQRCIVVRFTLI